MTFSINVIQLKRKKNVEVTPVAPTQLGMVSLPGAFPLITSKPIFSDFHIHRSFRLQNQAFLLFMDFLKKGVCEILYYTLAKRIENMKE